MGGAGDGNRTRMTSLEGCVHCAVRGPDWWLGWVTGTAVDRAWLTVLNGTRGVLARQTTGVWKRVSRRDNRALG